MGKPESQPHYQTTTSFPVKNIAKLILFSAIGIFMFFVPMTVGDTSSIPLDHVVTWLQKSLGPLVPWYALVIILLGALYPFITGNWKKSRVDLIFSLFKILGLVTAILLLTQTGPAWLFAPDIGPFLFEQLVIPVGILVPVGSIFLALLVGYGLLEFVGVLVRPIMRRVWKTPGRSAIDAVASFVGSYSLGLLITNRLYKDGYYTAKEATIIATGFSTVSATFMIVVAKTLGLMQYWNLYFWLTLIVTFLVTALTVHLPPIRTKSEAYFDGQGIPEPEVSQQLFRTAWSEALTAAHRAPSLGRNIWSNLKDGLVMTMAILPSILSVGLIGLLLAKFTPLFDWLGYLFLPFTWLVQLPEPLLAAKAAAVEIAEMFLPALVAAEAPLVTKFVIAIVSVSSILFFSASIPCILSTEIPISIGELVLIWVERTILTLLIATPLVYLLL
ncbi:nucleoside recognition membrane protein YjiH [Kroppenstedtia sanguinis]|uniref:YjiH family protein n=1 Tax=Kroppenstedtia sanguinis TaxID=1380684 RepID=UPI003D250CB1